MADQFLTETKFRRWLIAGCAVVAMLMAANFGFALLHVRDMQRAMDELVEVHYR